jgi:hypothetical protein
MACLWAGRIFELGGPDAGASEGSPDDILIPEQIMKRLQLATHAQLNELTRARCKHPLPVFRVGKGIRIRRSKLEQWIKEMEGIRLSRSY